MILPDVNLLLYAHIDAFPEHPRAKTWWEELLDGALEVGISSPSLYGFLRIASNPRVFSPPMRIEQALSTVEEWFARPHVRLLLPGPRHLEIAFSLLRATRVTRDLTTDAQIAALAIEHQGEVHSNDGDFARFHGLRWVNPLA
jgi:uncharacterized protein